jgi:DNA (cytosine-5)-methyltransferase 1
MSFSYYEFFAGGGMARLGLGGRWQCLFANDFCPKKAASYRKNFPDSAELAVDDVWNLSSANIPAKADIAWASFPCQDLSLAGARKGLSAKRSGSFWGFWRIIQHLSDEGRAPDTLVLENVTGLLTSHHGGDFQDLLSVLMDGGYKAGALVIDGAYFTPQSRPRLFIVATKLDVSSENAPANCWLTPTLLKAYDNLPQDIRANWLWLPLPAPPPRCIGLERMIDAQLTGKLWRTAADTQKLLAQMSPSNAFKVEQATKLAQSGCRLIIGMGYRRTRMEHGDRVQRFEVRFDGLAGCLRTPGGGSSRQFVLFVEPDRIRIRLLSAREAARLMGIPDAYLLPDRYNDAYHLCGDGVVVGVVRWLAGQILEPMIEKRWGHHDSEERYTLSAVS